MEAFLVSTGIVALGEMGDKTQLLALLLAARFRRPVPIVLGILVATLVNHALAGAVGDWIARALGPDVLPDIGHTVDPRLVERAIDQLRTFLPKRAWREAFSDAPVVSRVASSRELGS